MKRWRYIRVAVISLAAIGDIFFPAGAHATARIGWGALAAIFVFSMFALVPVLAVQLGNSRSAKTWHRPSWDLNPFTFRDPLQLFHLAAYAILAGGVVNVIRLLFRAAPFSAELLVPLAMAAGLFISIHLIPKIFRSKFQGGT
jgi:hypothetical protein